MKLINLRKYYSQYQTDFYVEVADEIAFCLDEIERKDHAYRIRRLRYRAYYSLDKLDGIEKDIELPHLTPHEVFVWKLTCQQLLAAIFHLPTKQSMRIYAHFYLGMNQCAIAHMEGVSEGAVRASIRRGLRSMKIFLQNY